MAIKFIKNTFKRATKFPPLKANTRNKTFFQKIH